MQGRQLDPDIFNRSSHAGVQVKLASPEDQAHRLCSRQALRQNRHPGPFVHYLKKAKEEGYRDFKDVYKTVEFAALRKDPRFAATDGLRKRRSSRLTVVRCAETQRIPRRIAETNLSRART